MLNAAHTAPQSLGLVDFADPVVADYMVNGKMNTGDETLLVHIRSSIRRGHPQMRPGPVNATRVCLVGSGPSLAETEGELRQLLWDGAALVTVNGAYQWCIERNLKPQTHIVMDARPGNARFLSPAIPHCHYVLASQCAPEAWDAVEGRPSVWIFHPVVKAEGEASALLDGYYQGNWMGVGGGTTVATRAISLLRMTGHVRFDLFGIDCCWHGDQHHAFAQPENDGDQRSRVFVRVKDHDDETPFLVSPWHIKQVEDLLTVSAINGKHFHLEVHGKGMFAHILRVLGREDPSTMSFRQE